MKKYLKFINEYHEREQETIKKFQKSQTIMSEDETIDYIKKYCNEWLKYPVKIVRNIDYNELYFHQKPVKRYSRDNPNYYTTIMDNSEEWKDYPKRGESLICSYMYNSMGGYSYYVIPENNSWWGVAPKHDIFISFDNIENIRFINHFFEDINWAYNKYFNDEMDDINIENFEQQILKLQEILKNTDWKDKLLRNELKDKRIKNIFKKYFINNDNAYLKILSEMNPNKNGFKLLNLKGLYEENTLEKNEIWTDSPAIFINHNKINDIFKKLNIKF